MTESSLKNGEEIYDCNVFKLNEEKSESEESVIIEDRII